MDYLYTSEQAADLRQRILNEYIRPRVKAGFDRYPQLQSATLLVAQYWADEANDAVHELTIFSVLETPDLEAAFKSEGNSYYEHDLVNLPDFQKVHYEIQDDAWDAVDRLIADDSDPLVWDSNGSAIPLFAAFCKEGCHQEMEPREAYTPYAILRRKSGAMETEVIGQMFRPQLNGVKPEEWEE
jgi:hypothetical protein